jgi:hypothetical protein
VATVGKVVIEFNWSPRLLLGDATDPTGTRALPVPPQSGWSETYYVPLADFNQSTVAATVIGIPDSNALVNARLKLLPYSAGEIIGVRVSDTSNPRNAWSFAPMFRYPPASGGLPAGPNTFPIAGTLGKGQGTPNWQKIRGSDVDAAVRLLMQTANGASRRGMTLRGLPQFIVGPGGAYQSDYDPWRTVMNNFRQVLTQPNAGVSLRTISKTTPPGAPISVLATSVGDNRSLVVTTPTPVIKNAVSPVNVAGGDTVIIRGVKGGYRANGPWRVLSVAGVLPQQQYTLYAHRRNVALPPVVNPGATLSYLAYLFNSVTSAVDEGEIIYAHRTGRPFGLQVGRRPAR